MPLPKKPHPPTVLLCKWNLIHCEILKTNHIILAQAFERMMSPTGPVPNSSVSSESSSAVPSVEEAQILGGASSPSPSALLPISALKQPGFEGTDAKYNRAAYHVWDL